MHLLITSRRELDIDTALSALVNYEICMRNELIDADISAFVHENLEQDRRLKRWPPSVKADIESTLREGAAGMYVFSARLFNISEYDGTGSPSSLGSVNQVERHDRTGRSSGFALSAAKQEPLRRVMESVAY